MFKLLDIYYFKNPREIDLNMAVILVTSSGYRLYVFDKQDVPVTKKIYITLSDAKADFYKLHVNGINGKRDLRPHWMSVVKEVTKRWSVSIQESEHKDALLFDLK